jgi:SNF2 family DNA or RNA helicase
VTAAVAYSKTLAGGRGSLAPWIKDEIEFYPHQIEGIRILARWKNFILADDMGLGKTITTLTVFGIDVFRGWASKAIVVCPVALKSNWLDEIKEFTGFEVVVVDGGPKKRAEQLHQFRLITKPKILVINYEGVKGHLLELNAMQFDMAIYDEAHYLKNPKSQRTKACLDLNARRSAMLSGTPMLNHVNELWPLLHKVNPQQYPRYWGFVNRYCVFGGWKDKQIVGVKNERELTDKLQSVMLRRLKKDVLGLPEVQYIDRRVDLTPQQIALYNKVVEEMILPRVDTASPDEIENALTKFLRLKQICGTTLEFTGEDHSAKLDLAVEDDEEILENGHKIVVFTQFRGMQQAYVKRMKDRGHAVYELHGDIPRGQPRHDVLGRWKANSGPAIICCMFQVASVGLNMTEARYGSFLDEQFVPGLNQQAVDRMHRIGASMTQPVQIRKYIARNTIESRVRAILKVKTKLFGDIVEADPEWKRKVAIELIQSKVA